MLRFERFNTFYIFNLHLDARWGRHNSQRYGGIFSMYRNHWSNTLSTNFSDMDNYKVNSNANPVTRVFSEIYSNRVVSVKDKFTLRSTDGLKVSAHASYYFRQVPRVTNEPERYRDFSAGIKGEWTITDNDYVELAYAFDQYDKSTLQRSQNLDIRSYSNVQNSVRALYNHTMGRGDILTVGGDMMRDYLMNDKLTEGAQDYLINGAHLEDYSRAELKAIRGSRPEYLIMPATFGMPRNDFHSHDIYHRCSSYHILFQVYQDRRLG